MIRHFSHIFFVEGLTFIVSSPILAIARGRVRGQATIGNRSVRVVAGDSALAKNRSFGHRKSGKDPRMITRVPNLLKFAPPSPS
jgi:hypothetical protein